MAIRDLISVLEKNPSVRSIVLLALILGAFITIGSFFNTVRDYLYQNVFTAANIADQVSHLAAGQDISYFKKYLGPQILQREVSSKLTELIFTYKDAYVQTLVQKKDDQVIYWAITYCGSAPLKLERPVFSMPGEYSGVDAHGNEVITKSLAPQLLLNKSTFADFIKNKRGEFHVNISGATANSYAYEVVSYGNPSAYQTLIVGVNDVCPSFDLEGALGDDVRYIVQGEPPTDEDINSLRRSVRLNTYAETAPFMGEEVVGLLNSLDSGDIDAPYLDFGVDRIRVRYFNNQ